MSETAQLDRKKQAKGGTAPPAGAKPAVTLPEHIVEVISDSGEGAQRCGQALAGIAARSGGNGIWTVEIIPAEIQPPARSVAGASGIRIRIGAQEVTNGGDEPDLVVAFNEQVSRGRVRAGELKPGATLLLENAWRDSRDASIVKSFNEAVEALAKGGFRVIEIPLERECRSLMSDARRGKNMFVLGMLCSIYSLDLQLARDQVALTSARRTARSSTPTSSCSRPASPGRGQPRLQVRDSGGKAQGAQVVTNGNVAIALASSLRHGYLRDVPDHAGTSASHYLSDCFEKVGASSIRRRTRSPPAPSRSAPPTRAGAP